MFAAITGHLTPRFTPIVCKEQLLYARNNCLSAPHGSVVRWIEHATNPYKGGETSVGPNTAHLNDSVGALHNVQVC